MVERLSDKLWGAIMRRGYRYVLESKGKDGGTDLQVSAANSVARSIALIQTRD